MAIKFPDSDGLGNPGTPELSFESHIVPEFITDDELPSDLRPHSLSEYYKLGDYVPEASPENDNIPTSGTIQFSDFYGAVNSITVAFTNNQYTVNGVTYTANMNTTLDLYNIASLFTTPVNNIISVPFIFEFDANTIFNNSVIVGGQFANLKIDNSGVIAGRGGHGYPLSQTAPSKTHIGATANNNNGNAAILINYDVDLLEVTNRSSAVIAGGGNGGSAPFSAHTFDFVNGYNATPNPSEWIDTYGDGYAGGGGGWNGGVGGYGRAVAFAEAYETDDDGTRDTSGRRYGPNSDANRTDQSYFGQPPPALAAYYVTSRSASGTTGHTGVDTVQVDAEANRSAPSISNPTRPSGGTGLNGGTYGKARAVSIGDFGGVMGCASTAEGVSGSGGGSGIGSGSGPVNVSSSGQTGAGAGHSIEISSGVTVTSGTFTNNGRRYGSTDL